MNQKLEDTFLKALEENQQKLIRVCSVYAEDEDDKKDLLQEVLANIWQSLPTFKSNSSLSTWMFRITLNVCLRLQSKRDKMKSHFKNMGSITIANIRSEERNNDNHDQLNKLIHCIKNLNDADKAVITLYLEELPYNEISDITGLSENNVAVKLKRMKNKLLNCINGKS
ncbi:MAG: sigma-70 family RNA polymerase sigma factor [Cyclobacteriaceae bacterium]|jgi:RNA polymerase sigma factor (sigma-70 family)|nr:sigma-70 family RNA polymerase sigma factor [Cyclobacteriaceae bacterium]